MYLILWDPVRSISYCHLCQELLCRCQMQFFLCFGVNGSSPALPRIPSVPKIIDLSSIFLYLFSKRNITYYSMAFFEISRFFHLLNGYPRRGLMVYFIRFEFGKITAMFGGAFVSSVGRSSISRFYSHPEVQFFRRVLYLLCS